VIDSTAVAKAGVNRDNRADTNLLSLAEMTDNQQSSALTPIPSPADAGEGSVVTEMVVNHFRNNR
jgi:hypothetical protein